MAILTIGGNIGSGKTTLAARLAKALGYEELHMGNLFREMAREEGISIETFYAALKDDPDLERSLDEKQRKLMVSKGDLVVQGRIAWFFAKESPYASFNMFLSVDPKIGAARSGQRKENEKESVQKMIQDNKEREAVERERYRALYGIENYQDAGHYDLVLDTTRLTEDELFKTILEKVREKMGGDV